MNEVVVVNYGAGNLRSVSQALEHCGATALVTDDPVMISTSRKIVLPGVGAFPAAMQELDRRGLSDAIKEAVGGGGMLMGICLGMQLLFDASDEFGTSAGLGLVPGSVTLIPSAGPDGKMRKVPHIGWNELLPGTGGATWGNSLLRSVPISAPVYFLHSYMANPTSPDDRIADSLADGLPVTAMVQRGDVFGCQFHPEKSGPTGLKVFEEFIRR